MYVFFEHHKDAEGTVLATDVVVSSWEHTASINWKRDKIPFAVLNGLLKSPPIKTRTYDDNTHIWTYLGTSGFDLLSVLQNAFNKLNQHMEFREVQDLEEQVLAGAISSAKSKKIDPSTFYYNRVPVRVELTKESAAPILAKLLECSIEQINKSLYRQAALKFHPDRNSGDGSKMSELNMLWRIYNG